MAPKLYMTEICPCVRAVLLTARALKVTLELEEVDFSNKEHLTSTFLKLNPQHTVPILEDSGFVIWDSHAIIAYLVGKYGDDSFYPKDVNRRALIDQLLHFDSSIVSAFTRKILNPILNKTEAPNWKEHENCIQNVYKLMENFFVDDDCWITGKSISIADFSLLSSVTSVNLIVPIEENVCPKLYAWIKRAEGLPWYAANENGLNKLKIILDKYTHPEAVTMKQTDLI